MIRIPSFIEVHLASDSDQNTGNAVKEALETHPDVGPVVEVAYAFDNNESNNEELLGATGTIEFDAKQSPKTFVFVRGDEAVFGLCFLKLLCMRARACVRACVCVRVCVCVCACVCAWQPAG